jgi:hypothetical protein
MDELNPRARRFRRAEYSDERDLDAFWAEIRPRREPMHQKWFLPLVFALLALSIPWYRKSGEIGSILLGLPVWVWITLACSALVSALTAAMSLFFWDDDDPRERED